jgi:DUF4097 and DUF4098 domain-containing protein YvlB
MLNWIKNLWHDLPMKETIRVFASTPAMKIFAAATILLGLWFPVRSLIANREGETRTEVRVVARARQPQPAQRRAADRSTQRGERVAHRQFDIGSGGTLRVDFQDGDIQVETRAGSVVEVEVFVRARDLDWGREVFEDMEFRTEVSGNVLEIRARDADIEGHEYRRSGGVEVLTRVTVPERFNVDISTSDGDIMVGNLQGDVQLKSSDGDIQLGQVQGGEIRIQTADGDVLTDEFTATSAVIRTADGDIDLSSVSGDLNASTADGDIQLRLREAGDVSLRTGDGDITIFAPTDLAAQIDFDGEDLNVAQGFEITGRVSSSRVIGRMNGGGPRLEARTGDGSISLRQGR